MLWSTLIGEGGALYGSSILDNFTKETLTVKRKREKIAMMQQFLPARKRKIVFSHFERRDLLTMEV